MPKPRTYRKTNGYFGSLVIFFLGFLVTVSIISLNKLILVVKPRCTGLLPGEPRTSIKTKNVRPDENNWQILTRVQNSPAQELLGFVPVPDNPVSVLPFLYEAFVLTNLINHFLLISHIYHFCKHMRNSESN